MTSTNHCGSGTLLHNVKAEAVRPLAVSAKRRTVVEDDHKKPKANFALGFFYKRVFMQWYIASYAFLLASSAIRFKAEPALNQSICCAL